MTPSKTSVIAETGQKPIGSDNEWSVEYADSVDPVSAGQLRPTTTERSPDEEVRSVAHRACVVCGNPLAPKQTSCCSHRCVSRRGAAIRATLYSMKGELNPAFKGWRSKTPVVYTREYKRRYPGRARAHRIVYDAIRSRRLVRPEFCDSCFLKRRLDAHHEDYSRPLSVEWLCRKCHMARSSYLRRRLEDVMTKHQGEPPTPNPEQSDRHTDVVRPALDLERLSRQTYLTVAELVGYLRFGSRKGAYHWIANSGIPKCRRGRTLLFLRRDVDEAVQGRLRRVRKSA